jgi:hypothetical protein
MRAGALRCKGAREFSGSVTLVGVKCLKLQGAVNFSLCFARHALPDVEKFRGVACNAWVPCVDKLPA